MLPSSSATHHTMNANTPPMSSTAYYTLYKLPTCSMSLDAANKSRAKRYSHIHDDILASSRRGRLIESNSFRPTNVRADKGRIIQERQWRAARSRPRRLEWSDDAFYAENITHSSFILFSFLLKTQFHYFSYLKRFVCLFSMAYTE